jgi:hypothetical protein
VLLLLLLQHLIQKQKSNLHFHNLKISNTEPAKYWPSQKSDIYNYTNKYASFCSGIEPLNLRRLHHSYHTARHALDSLPCPIEAMRETERNKEGGKEESTQADKRKYLV